MNMIKQHPAISLGIIITAIFLIVGFLHVDFLDALEFRIYDMMMTLRGEADKKEDINEIVIVDIDDSSIEKLGRWPWPRGRIAKGIGKITQANPRVIGLNAIYSEPEESDALKIFEHTREILLQKTSDPEIRQILDEGRKNLDNDRKFAESLRDSGKVVLPVFFKKTIGGDTTKAKAVELRKKNEVISGIRNPDDAQCPRAGDVVMPIPAFLEAAKGIGHVNLSPDSDGNIRREQLLYEFEGYYIPAFSLRLAALYLNIANNEIGGTLGSYLKMVYLEIPTTPACELLVSFKGPEGAFKRYSFFDVITDKIPHSVFRDKIVLITPSASGIMNPISTSVQNMSVGEFTANAIWAMLHRRFIKEPFWNRIAWLIMTLAMGAVITLVLPRMKALKAGMIFAGISALLVGGSTLFFVSKGLWIQITYPLIQMISGYIGVVTIKYFVTETRKEKVEGESAESSKMLGISYQSQGLLDMAFEKFRKVPVDDEMKRLLYVLATEYEKKRMFSQAAAVYEYIEEHDSDYKDVAQRKRRLLQATETMLFGDGFLGGASQGDALIGDGTMTRPTLGRYEIIKQLGKGAMGIVYLGVDPRINRQTAIKTFTLGENLDAEDTKIQKQKFFREAESAGTLSHPNIVTIYDAGEERDLAYIAMEFLEGDDLQKYTKKNNLLPMRKVLDYVADIADALDYAHEKGIVHRDIKPANVMLIKSGVVKITDFGIARITASSQTQTGVVKGTPHYMSPEQISGEKVNGQSDIFSLGAMLFQLLTGDVPFHGDSPAALMHQIMNIKHPDPRSLNPKLLKPHVTIIDKAMEKDRKKRYQRASQMASHLRMLGKKIDDLAQKRKMAAG